MLTIRAESRGEARRSDCVERKRATRYTMDFRFLRAGRSYGKILDFKKRAHPFQSLYFISLKIFFYTFVEVLL